MDSGATCHVSNDVTHFEFLTPSKQPVKLNMPDGSFQLSSYTGLVVLSSGLTLHNVHYVPRFSFCLLSVHKLCEDSKLDIHFSNGACSIKDQASKRTVGIAHLRDSLYYLTEESVARLLSLKNKVP